MTGRADHFSVIAKTYAAFRPHYPRELFDYVASIVDRHRVAWDFGAGNGQATVDLAERFDEVIGTDSSAEQIAKAPAHPKIRWLVAPAESVPLAATSVDLTTVAQALHWFDHERFYDEVRRVSAPGAAIAVWMYASPRMDGDAGAALKRMMYETVGEHWPPERQYVEQEYRTIPFPFPRLAAPQLALVEHWALDRVVGYSRSWSATAQYVAAHGTDPVIGFERELREIWGDPAEQRTITWPLVVIAGRVREK